MTVPMLPLRPYQRAGIDAAFSGWTRGLDRIAEVFPTGTGKTVTYAHLAKEWFDLYPRDRIVMVAHRDELLDQGRAKTHDIAPDIITGTVAARTNETLAAMIFGSVATLRQERRCAQIRDVGLVIIDECHHAPADSYVRILRHFGCMSDWPSAQRDGRRAKALGVTATMTRGDNASLNEIWQDVVYTYEITEAIRDGYLVHPRGRRVYVESLSLAGLKRQAGDISEASAGAAIEASLAPEAVAKAYQEHAAERPGVLFAPTVRTAELFAEGLRAGGFTAEVAHGKMTKVERRAFMNDVNRGKIQISCNCGVYTEGTDVPQWSCAVLARPTLQPGLYIQMAGRVLRPAAGKDDALILDVVGASQRHSLLGALDLFGTDLIVDREEEVLDEDVPKQIHSPECEAGDGSTCPRGYGGEFICQCWCHLEVAPEVDEEPDWIDGPLAYKDVDLFHGSTSMWLRTYAGIRFLPVGSGLRDQRLIVILPGQIPLTWDVASLDVRRTNFGSRWIRQGVNDLSYALAYAEGDMNKAEQRDAAKDRDWRKRAPTDRDRRDAISMGIPITPGITAGELRMATTMRRASARIDLHLPPYVRAAMHAGLAL